MSLRVKQRGTSPLTGSGHSIIEQAMHSKVLHGRPVAGAVTYNERLLDFSSVASPFLNAEHGNALNVDATFSGTPLGVHNGIDTTFFTGSNIVGVKVTFNDTTRPFAGTNSVEIDNPALNDSWQFLNPAGTIAAGAYVAITAKVNIDRDWTVGDEVQIYAWDSSGGVQVGGRVDLTTYINESEFDVWHTLVIPFADMGISGLAFDSIRMEQTGRDGKAARWYLDNMQLEESGEPIVYKVAAPGVAPFYVDTVRFCLVGPLAATLLNGTMPALSYDKILGLSALANGMVLRRVEGGVTKFSAALRQLSDFICAGATLDQPPFGDGTNTMISLAVQFDHPIRLQPHPDLDYMSLTLSDDLSGLVLANAIALGGEVVV